MASSAEFGRNAARLSSAARRSVENVVVYRRIDSTQSCALRLIEQAETEEIVLPTTLIIADRQEAGRGRSGRNWVSPIGGLYLSWIASELDRKVMARLPMIAAVAAVDAVVRLGVDGVGLKWPNDLLVGGRKLAGLLIHARHGATSWVTVGFGINLETPEIPADGALGATSLTEHLEPGGTVDLAVEIVRVFAERLVVGITDPDTNLARWRETLIHHPGDEMVIRRGDGSEIRGRFAGLTEDGHLRLDCTDGEHIITTGDVVE